MELGTNVTKGGAIVAKSRNLRAMLRYASKSPVVEMWSSPMGEVCGTLQVRYADGATCRGNWRSYTIMIDWIRARRTWRSAKHHMAGPNVGYLTKPGLIAGK